MSKTPEISVILPAFNESENIEDTLLSVYRYFEAKFPTFEVIVVNDGSTDDTPEKVRKFSKRKKNLILVNHPQNRGYGATLRSGFNKASGRLIFYTDSDGQYQIKDLDLILPYTKKFDIVAGYRIKRQDPKSRIFIASVYNLLIRLLFNLDIKDVDCSFKIYHKKIFDKIKLRSETGLIDAEVLVKAEKEGFSLIQVGVSHFPRSKGKSMYHIGGGSEVVAFVRPRVIFDLLKEIKKLWKELR